MSEVVIDNSATPDYSDNAVLDAVELNGAQWKRGFIRALIYSAIAVFVFFVSLTIDGKSNVVFGFIYKYLKALVGIWGVWFSCLVVVVNAIASLYCALTPAPKNKQSWIREYCSSDTIYHTIFYVIGAVYIVLYTMDVSIAEYKAPEWLMHPEIAPVVIGSIVVDCVWILPVGAFFMPFLITYGLLDFVGAFMESIMRPLFETPGRSALDAVGSFVSAASVGVMITNSLYHKHVYTKKEAAIIATGFSAVSIGFAYMVIEVAGLSHRFIEVYAVSMLLCFAVTAVCAKLPPLRGKERTYIDGKLQTADDIKKEKLLVAKGNPFVLGFKRAVKKGYVAPSIIDEIKTSLLSVFYVIPKVFSLMTAVCITAMIIAFYTPFFTWVGWLFEPLLNLLRVPEASKISSSFSVGIAEMFLPVLMISDKVNVLPESARFMVAAVSMVQIIFFSDSACVMLALKMPITFKDLVIIFFERTILAIIIVAPIMHLLF